MSPGEGSLALATTAFVGTHLLMSHPLRPALVGRLGERGFALLYSLISFVTLGWMIVAWRSIEASQPLWMAPDWWRWAASALMLAASILLVGSLIRNPAFPHPGAEPRAIPDPDGVFRITRHPMNWSFMLWALVHISVWGSPRNLIVAGGILLLALLGSIGQDAKKSRLLGDTWRDWQRRTALVPFGRGFALPGARASVGGVLLWAAITYFHARDVSPGALI